MTQNIDRLKASLSSVKQEFIREASQLEIVEAVDAGLITREEYLLLQDDECAFFTSQHIFDITSPGSYTFSFMGSPYKNRVVIRKIK